MTENFWRHYPALFYAFAGLLGCFMAFYSSWSVLLPLVCFFGFSLYYSRQYLIRLILAFATSLSFYLYCSTFYRVPLIPEEGLMGICHMQINSLSLSSTHYGKHWVYKGTLKSFTPLEKKEGSYNAHGIPFRLTLQVHPELQRPLANRDYIVKGLLKSSPNGPYLLLIKKEDPWSIINSSRSLAEWRYQAKKSMGSYIRNYIQNPLSASFLTGIATGDFDDRRMQFEFGRFGILLNKRGSGLNSLGFALLLILLYDPHMCCQIGFQLSFLATLSILMLFNGIDYQLQKIFLKRRLSEAIMMGRLSQYSYLLLSYCRQGLALSLAVNLATLPLVLYYFHKFSLMSLLYNLFFPFMVSLSMILLIFGSLTSMLFPPLGQFIHLINDSYTSFMLNYIYNMPRTADILWSLESIPHYVVVFLLCAAFYIGLWMHHTAEKQREWQHDFDYI